ncbi:hypothetical protein [Schumannella luteola]
MRRELITWSVVAAIVLGAFGLTVLVLNNTVYNASGFVQSYLDTLARKDAAGALEMIGAYDNPDEASDTLLRRSAMSELTDIRLTSDIEVEGGVHKVTFTYSADGTPGRTTFEVKATGLAFGLFPSWEFVTGPLSTMYVTVVGDARFSANGIDLVSPTPNDPAGYLVFTPSSIRLNHDTTYLDAEPVTVAVADAGASVPTALMVKPNALMLERVQEQVDDILDTCATQQVLMPTGCPFGQSMGNRIITSPAWSIVQYPEVSLRAGDRSGDWIVPSTPATAHLVVDVRSLFDGSVSTFDEDVPFSVSYSVAFLPGDELLVTTRF